MRPDPQTQSGWLRFHRGRKACAALDCPYREKPLAPSTAVSTWLERARRRRLTGFSLVELLVVIGIIALFASMLVNFTVIRGGAVRQTQLVLAAAKGIAQEYEIQVGSPVAYSGALDDVDSGESIRSFVAKAQQLPVTKQMLEALGDDVYVNADGIGGKDTLLDGWGRPLRYRPRSELTDTNTIMPYNHPFLASGGADGQWGTFTSNTNGTPEIRDNVYSFNLE